MVGKIEKKIIGHCLIYCPFSVLVLYLVFLRLTLLLFTFIVDILISYAKLGNISTIY